MFLTSLYVRVSTMWNERGATAVEYGLMVALIAIAIIATVTLLGTQLNSTFTFITGKLTAATK